MIRKKLKSFGSILATFIIIIETVLILTVIATKVSGKTPSLFGYNMCVVATPSMEPVLKVNDLIISETYEKGEKLEIGDIVTYNGRVGDFAGKLITHQVENIKYDENGHMTVITKGTANSEADPPVDGVDIVSVMKYKTHVLGPLYRIVKTTPGFIILIELPMALLIIDGIVGLVKEVRKEGNEIENSEDK